ncbi:hypothetical protein KDN24_06225 [Bacillus sp. Bva_UNVM-123]|uniref:hypothetical protein n=1 Tax=Bacillus sp. Bva_UNVM-123 TaxID=2829798 RepID=UPI00391F64AC
MSETNFYADEWIELANMTDFITQYGSGASLTDIKLSDLYRYLKNPYANIKDIQKASKYLTNKHGIIKEVLRALKSLPTLDYVLSWSVIDDDKKLKKYEKKVHDFLKEIDLKNMIRDGLYEVGEMGTVVACLRKDKYVQFLDLDDLRINKQRNGKWVVEFDLKSIDTLKSTQEKTAIIESLPEEVTIAKFNLFKNKGEDYRYVELKDCDVVNTDAHRNFPYGLPLTMGAWSSLLQKEMISRVERSVADRLIKQVLILAAGHLDKAGEKPVPKEIIQAYFKEVSSLMQKKEGINQRGSVESSGTGTIALPHFLSLKTLDVNTEMFKKELYQKIDNDIYSNLGISPAVIWGGGESGNFSSATLNSQKFFRYIFTLLEKFESLINRYIKRILPSNISCEFVFSKTTMLDKDAHIDKLKELYMQTGISKFWIESLTGLPYENVISQASYEKKFLKTGEILSPPANAYTQSGKNGRPNEENPTNQNTIKSKGNGGNNNPSPSD